VRPLRLWFLSRYLLEVDEESGSPDREKARHASIRLVERNFALFLKALVDLALETMVVS